VDESVIAIRPALRSYVGRTVVLGIRPEDMEDAALKTDAPEDRRIKTSVELREDMGSEILVHFPIDSPPLITDDTRELAEDRGLDVEELESETEKTTFIARFSANTQAQVDDHIEVHVDTRTLYFFDPNTGGSIHAEAPVLWAPAVSA
jgi:multiple sugar transport system ATP-binding protein